MCALLARTRFWSLLGCTVCWTLQEQDGRVRVFCDDVDGKQELASPFAQVPLQRWTEGDDLLAVGDTFVRLHPDGTASSRPPEVVAVEQRESGRMVGVRYVDQHGYQPVDVRTGDGLAPPTHDLARNGLAWIEGRAWRLFGDGALTIDGVAVACDRPLGLDPEVATLPDALVVRDAGGIQRVDGRGRCLPLAPQSARRSAFDREVFTDGDLVLWTESDESASVLKCVSGRGGEPRILATRAPPEAIRVADAYQGRVLLREERDRVSGVMRTREAIGLSILELPVWSDAPNAAVPRAPGPTLHDDVERLPLDATLADALRSAGAPRVVDVNPGRLGLALSPAQRAEVTYALARYQAHVSDPRILLRRIDSRLLAPTSVLDLPRRAKGTITARAPTLADVVTRTQADWLKMDGVGRNALRALEAALEKRGLELGRRWADLADRSN
ncbi:MAG: hypothetical protein KC933_02085 [Myxococcales bacterium]|nr:hypothetical protein [Myxococcales bacterium]